MKNLKRFIKIIEICIFNRELIKYIFSKPSDNNKIWTSIWCRLKGHPCGVIYYNPQGFEPDYTCKNCGDDCG